MFDKIINELSLNMQECKHESLEHFYLREICALHLNCKLCIDDELVRAFATAKLDTGLL